MHALAGEVNLHFALNCIKELQQKGSLSSDCMHDNGNSENKRKVSSFLDGTFIYRATSEQIDVSFSSKSKPARLVYAVNC